MPDDRVVIVGGGIGGLAAALDLATQGLAVTVVERAAQAGGKMRETHIAGTRIDSGPTVFTMRWVFDELFAAAGSRLEAHLALTPLSVLARHAWSADAQNADKRLDLFADIDRAADAIAAFSGPAEASRFRGFCAEARTIYRTLKQPFLSAQRPDPFTLTNRIGFHRLGSLAAIRPFESLWGALSKHFHDPRLRQLFGRYATYNGSSPFMAPATLMLIAHVEQDGVWSIDGGMQRLAEALETVAKAKGADFRFNAEAREICMERGQVSGVMLGSGEMLKASAVIVNADAAALSGGLLGGAASRAIAPMPREARSLSAVTWAMTARTDGFPLLRHNVFFSQDYAAEFDDIFGHGRLPAAPTVYVCAQDRQVQGADDGAIPRACEKLLLLINAPPSGDTNAIDKKDIAQCETRTFELLERCGLLVTRQSETITGPADFHRLFPATGGALYGRASHGWMASFRRPASHTAIKGLYLAGGSTHPGAGVPMAALSGRLAAQRLLSDRASTRPYRRAAISGGISTG